MEKTWASPTWKTPASFPTFDTAPTTRQIRKINCAEFGGRSVRCLIPTTPPAHWLLGCWRRGLYRQDSAGHRESYRETKGVPRTLPSRVRSEEHTSELQSLR